MKEIDFYGSCFSSSGETHSVDNDKKCFNDRCRTVDPSNPLEKGNNLSSFYPGYDADEREPKSHKVTTDDYPNTHRHIRSANPYTKPLFTLQSSNCRILQTKNKDVRKRCDRIIETRPLEYKEAITLFPPGSDLTMDETDFDLLEFF